MVIALFASVLVISPYVNEHEHPFQSLGLVFGVFASYLVIAHWKGEPNSRDR